MNVSKRTSRLLSAAFVAVLVACVPQHPRIFHPALVSCPGGNAMCANRPAAGGVLPNCAASGSCANGICSFAFNAGSACAPGDLAYCNPPGGSFTDCDSSAPANVTVCGTKQCVDSAAPNPPGPCTWGACTPPGCTPTCSGNSPVTCNAAGNRVVGADCGASATCVNAVCQPKRCTPSCTGNVPVSCDPNNNPVTGKDCAPATCSNGVCQTPPPPCVPGGACKALGAVGECANGTITCPSGGGTSCAPGPRTAEICDGKDNDCDGIVDNLPAHNDTVLDAAITRNGNLFGISDNTMYGPSDCGGTRVSASATKSSGGGDCSVVDWADIACQTPDKHIGNSTLTAACKVFKQQGGVPGNNSHDCRYIVHVGAPSTQGVVCQASHFFAVQPICP